MKVVVRAGVSKFRIGAVMVAIEDLVRLGPDDVEVDVGVGVPNVRESIGNDMIEIERVNPKAFLSEMRVE